MTTAPFILVRRPGRQLDSGLVTHVERQPIDIALAYRQWETYVEAFRRAGWSVVEVEPADDCPDAVFIEDAIVVFGTTAVITRPGAPSRRPETDGARTAAIRAGLEPVEITAPGTLDGGDVLKVGKTVYVGLSDRTNVDGVEQLRRIVEGYGLTVVGVPLTKVLHLKSAITALPDGTVVGWAPAIDDPSVFGSCLPMPEEAGAHVVDLGNRAVLMAADCPASTELVRSLGFDVVTVDISEFVKLEGCVTCLSVRVRSAVDTGSGL